MRTARIADVQLLVEVSVMAVLFLVLTDLVIIAYDLQVLGQIVTA